MKNQWKERVRTFFFRLAHWEFWPFWAIYYPLLPAWLYFSLKARSLFFFNAVNPSITNGGMALESKKAIYDLVPQDYLPITVLIEKKQGPNGIRDAVESAKLNFPLIAKPDVGMKGLGVERIADYQGLYTYQRKIKADFIIQELVTYPQEFGVFFVRFPGDLQGRITGIVAKEFLSVTGNGRDTLEKLICDNPRSRFQLSKLAPRFNESWHQIMPEGVRTVLVPFGSHTRGAKFTDESIAISAALETSLNRICCAIDGFYYGRLDILCTSLEDLAHGRGFKIIEVNGAGSEPTHIYDPSHSIFFAWKEILAHWSLMCQISRINRKRGVGFLSYREGLQMLRANNTLEAQLRLL